MKAYEVPEKVEVNHEVINKVIDDYVEDTSFTVKFGEDEESTEITFRTYVHPLDLALLVNQAVEIAIKQDEMKRYYIDYCGMQLAIHMFIFSAMSTMKDLYVVRDDDTVPDVKSIGGLGQYLYATNKTYCNVFEALYAAVKEVVVERVAVYNDGISDLARAVSDGLVDVSKVFQDTNLITGLSQEILQKIYEK